MNIYIQYFAVFLMAFASGASLVVVSHKVQGVEREIARAEREISREQEAIRILNADWAYLNNPAYLEAMATRYLNLSAPKAEGLVSDFSSLSGNAVESEAVPLEADRIAVEGARVPTAENGRGVVPVSYMANAHPQEVGGR